LDDNELQEERRICYVGMTRAMEKLYLTNAWKRTIYGRTSCNPISRFLEEIPQDLIEIVGAEIKENINSNWSAFGNNIKKEDNNNLFEVGDSVEHPKWGQGIVVQIKADEVSVAFPEQGIKKLSLKYAPIKKTGV
jgi:DNA helicase-2/ATP-dependent DNA helicase PcrA